MNYTHLIGEVRREVGYDLPAEKPRGKHIMNKARAILNLQLPAGIASHQMGVELPWVPSDSNQGRMGRSQRVCFALNYSLAAQSPTLFSITEANTKWVV